MNKCCKILPTPRGIDINKRFIKRTNGQPCLHYAVNLCHIDCITKIVESIGVDINEKNIKGETALHIASHGNNNECVKKLLQYQAIDVSQKNKQGETALHIACKTNNNECLKTLLADIRIDVNSKSFSLETPLHYACRYGNIDTLKILLDYGADLDVTDDHQQSPLHYVARFGYNECLETLLTHVKISPCISNGRDSHKYTPLYYALVNKHYDSMETLLKYNENSSSCVISEKYRYGWTVLHEACRNGDIRSVILFLTHCANIICVINQKDKLGRIPLHLCFDMKPDISTPSRKSTFDTKVRKVILSRI